MATIKSRIRKLMPLALLERFYVAYWRQHKDKFAKELGDAQVVNLGITEQAYDRRNEFYQTIHNRYIGETPIIFLEFGVFQGESILGWAAMNDHPNSRFIGFDTFEGLPEAWKNYDAGHFSTDRRVPETDDERVHFVAGLFQDTLDDAVRNLPGGRRLVLHIDSDLYSAALYILTRLHDQLVPGTLILFDQWVDIHEYRALTDYVGAYGTRLKLVGTMNDAFSKVVFQVEARECDAASSPLPPLTP